MQFCHDHWHELKNAIRKRGLWGLVRTSSTGSEPEGYEKPPTPDPLEIITLMISEQALMAFGIYLLTHHCCPLCEVEQNLGKGLSFEWIDVDADHVMTLCKQQHTIDS